MNNEKLRRQLTDESEFDQDFIDETASRYLEACRAGNGEANGYANNAYRFSKVLLNAYLRLLEERLAASRPRKIDVYNVHPGFVRTDMHNQVLQILGYQAYVDQVAQAGYHTATTTQRGRCHAGDTVLELPRVPVLRRTGRALLWWKLVSRYEDRRRA